MRYNDDNDKKILSHYPDIVNNFIHVTNKWDFYYHYDYSLLSFLQILFTKSSGTPSYIVPLRMHGDWSRSLWNGPITSLAREYTRPFLWGVATG